MDDCCKRLVHILGCAKLRNLSKPSIDLIAISRDDVVHGHKIFFVDQCLSPDLRVDLVS